jgi:hypothetical protein
LTEAFEQRRRYRPVGRVADGTQGEKRDTRFPGNFGHGGGFHVHRQGTGLPEQNFFGAHLKQRAIGADQQAAMDA